MPFIALFLFTLAGCAAIPTREVSPPKAPDTILEQKLKVYPFAPGSTNLRAGENGFLIQGGDFPDEMLGKGLGTDWYSRDITISHKGLKVVLETKPRKYEITINDTGYTPSILSIKKGEGLTTLTVTNRGTKPHRFGSTAFGSNSTVIFSGQDVTLSAPISRFPKVIVQENSVINISNEATYSHFYIEIKPGGTALLTFPGPDDNGWSVVEMFCDLPGHDEKIVLSGK